MNEFDKKYNNKYVIQWIIWLLTNEHFDKNVWKYANKMDKNKLMKLVWMVMNMNENKCMNKNDCMNKMNIGLKMNAWMIMNAWINM